MEQVVGIDSVIFIYLLERNQEFLPAARSILEAVESGQLLAVMSGIGMIEILTGPKKQGRFDLARHYRAYLTRFPNLTIKNMSELVVELASDLCARYNIKTVDGVHLATAIDFGASRFVTDDKELKRVKEIEVALL